MATFSLLLYCHMSHRIISLLLWSRALKLSGDELQRASIWPGRTPGVGQAFLCRQKGIGACEDWQVLQAHDSIRPSSNVAGD